MKEPKQVLLLEWLWAVAHEQRTDLAGGAGCLQPTRLVSSRVASPPPGRSLPNLAASGFRSARGAMKNKTLATTVLLAAAALLFPGFAGSRVQSGSTDRARPWAVASYARLQARRAPWTWFTMAPGGEPRRRGTLRDSDRNFAES